MFVMTISGLSYEQKLALVALLELFVMADGEVTEGEIKEINQIAEALGDEEYRELMNEADSRFKDIENLKELLKTIKERAARELIYGLLLEEVMTAPSPAKIPDILDWIKNEWQIEVTEAAPEE
jgi:hypothetical protein